MTSTYLELCNKVLRRLNEVPLDGSTFNDARGVHASVKDAVNDSINSIHSMKGPWKFNACSKQIVLTSGKDEYQFPSNYLVADWSSFQVSGDNISPTTLRKITRSEWMTKLKNNNYSESRPFYIIDSHDNRFAVSPVPDDEYTLEYWYFSTPEDLSLPDDMTTIPSRYDFVIVTGAMYFLNMFKGDNESAAMVENKFQKQVRDMWYQIGPVNNEMFDTRVPEKGY